MSRILSTSQPWDFVDTSFQSRPLLLHDGVICALTNVRSAGGASSGSSPVQIEESERVMQRIPALMEALYVAVEPLSGSSGWRLDVEDRTRVTERWAAALVRKAIDDLWGSRSEPEIGELRKLLAVDEEPTGLTTEERVRGHELVRALAPDSYRSLPMLDVKLLLAISAVICGTPVDAMATAVGDLVSAYMFADRDDDAAAMIFDYCLRFTTAYAEDDEALLFPPLVLEGRRRRLSGLAAPRQSLQLSH